MLKIKNGCIGMTKALDMFNCNQFFQYKDDTEYRTITGGCISIILIIVLGVIFANEGLKTINKEIITTNIDIINQNNPSPLEVVTSSKGGFMFAISIYGYNLNDNSTKYFNVTLRQRTYNPMLILNKSDVIPLIQCTQQHFGITDQVRTQFEQFDLSTFLCPPLDYSFKVGGRVSSKIFDQFSITVSKCNKNVDSRCVNSSTMELYQSHSKFFILSIPLVSAMINPSHSQYLSYYLQDRNYYPFNTNLSLYADAYIEETIISTDNSILPNTDISEDRIISIPDLFHTSHTLQKDVYARINFIKSSSSTTYNRSFNKIDNYFSYIGGLISTITQLLFIISIYSIHAFQISLASRLFVDDQGQSIKSRSYNFLYFITTQLKKIVNFINSDIKWKETDNFLICKKQMEKQLDIALILRKIQLIEKAIEKLFGSNQLQQFLNKKISLSQARDSRKKHEQFVRLLKQMIGPNLQQNKNSNISNQVFHMNYLPEQKNSQNKIQIQIQNQYSPADEKSSSSEQYNQAIARRTKQKQKSKKKKQFKKQVSSDSTINILPKSFKVIQFQNFNQYKQEPQLSNNQIAQIIYGKNSPIPTSDYKKQNKQKLSKQ